MKESTQKKLNGNCVFIRKNKESLTSQSALFSSADDTLCKTQQLWCGAYLSIRHVKPLIIAWFTVSVYWELCRGCCILHVCCTTTNRSVSIYFFSVEETLMIRTTVVGMVVKCIPVICFLGKSWSISLPFIANQGLEWGMSLNRAAEATQELISKQKSSIFYLCPLCSNKVELVHLFSISRSSKHGVLCVIYGLRSTGAADASCSRNREAGAKSIALNSNCVLCNTR